MVTIILIVLALLDVFLLGIVYFLGKQRINPVELLKEMDEERRLLKELGQAVKEEMEQGEQRCRDVLNKVTAIATDIDMEMKSGSEAISGEVGKVLDQVAERIQEPMKTMAKKQASLEALLKKVEKERFILKKSLARGEVLVKFFNQNLPYEEVMREIEDKKYLDARQLLSRGMSSIEVARELDLPESEVSLLVSLG